MAKVGSVNRNEKRERMANRDYEKRQELKKIISDPSVSYDEKMEARDALNKMPKNGSVVRTRKRCMVTGRPRGNYVKFQLCRIQFREMASRGELPGVTKSSW